MRPLLSLPILLLPVVMPAVHAAVVLDRIAVVVNNHPIKTSDIERDLRLTDFLNKATLKFDAADNKAAEERLIDQQIIRGEIASGGYRRASDADADSLLRQIRRDRYANSDVSLQRALAQYGLTEDQLRMQLLWQLTVLSFINERFRAGVLVSDEDVQKYYDQHRTELRAPLQTVSATIRTALEGEQVNQQFDMWLDGARRDAQIEYKPEAIQ
jgi:peptidyl-prolyl cis-trans isomerase SurA